MLRSCKLFASEASPHPSKRNCLRQLSLRRGAAEETVYEAKGRRSKKREQEELLPAVREHADKLAESLSGKIDWDEPLIEARLG